MNITINQELFIWIFAIWILIASITQIFGGIINNGEPREYSYWDSLNGIALLILLLLCIDIN